MADLMILIAATMLFAAVGTTASAQQQTDAKSTITAASSLSTADVQTVSPALARYAQEDVVDALWARPQLSARDRSIVTVSVLIARGQALDLSHYINVALDSGVTPRELSEAITHLAFYSGLPNAMVGVAAAKDVFAQRNIGAEQLPAASPELSAINQEGETARQAAVTQLLGTANPGLAEFTTDPLFHDVWLRPDLALRDRSLVTISSIMANGQVAQLPGHLNRALDNGLTPEQAGEVVAQVAFYAGWPNAFSAGPVVAEVLKKRQ
jgi:4-carboxymuconolactone decarboxylase